MPVYSAPLSRLPIVLSLLISKILAAIHMSRLKH